MAGEYDGVAPHVADGTPGEEQVGQFLQRWPALGDHLELRAIEIGAIERLDQQPAVDALELEPSDAVVGNGVRRWGRHGEQGEVLLGRQDAPCLVRVRRCDERLVGVADDLVGCLGVHFAVDRHDRAEGTHRIAIERAQVGLGQPIVRGQSGRVGLLDDGARGRGEVTRDAVGHVEVEQVVEAGLVAL